jgi:hypothetical protein
VKGAQRFGGGGGVIHVDGCPVVGSWLIDFLWK